MAKIGIIGCGKIAPFHADVLKELGHDIISVSVNTITETVNEFVQKYNVEDVFTDYHKMINSKKLDAIWVLTRWNTNYSVLADIISYKIPIFSEKPVGISCSEIRDLIELKNKYNTKVQIGHNRRFYDFIPNLKKKINEGNLRHVIVNIPETTSHLNKKGKEFLWIHNSSHVIDLLYHLVGDLSISSNLKSNKIDTLNDTFSSLLLTNNNVSVQISAIWNSAMNFSMKFFIDSRIYELKPIEFLNVYEGFDILEPNEEVPVRRYIPKKIYTAYASSSLNNYKPGFLNQTKYFFNQDLKGNFKSSSFEELLSITNLIENLM